MPRKLRILEETQRRASNASDEENPYWLYDEAQPHPDPSLGCIRRGYCCRSSPGWFGPGQVEQAAALLDLQPGDFVRKYLIIDGIEVDGRWVEVFAPVKLGRDGEPLLPPATRADRLYRMLRSPCVFFDGEGCQIYTHRPIECAAYCCTHEPEQNLSHEAIARLWLSE
ncbi:MAG: hypothetical protein RBU37_26930 [Myxococcota bacterium]|jgi:Fe-S-cluster containining protein|nr:hypothetical protein [Myxococcota bacterium]